MNRQPSLPANWYADFLQAFLVSSLAVSLLTGVLSLLRWHEYHPSDDYFSGGSITQCVFSQDGSQALINLRTPEPGRNSPRHRLVAIDLRTRLCLSATLPWGGEPRQLLAADDHSAFVLDPAGHGERRRVDTTCGAMGPSFSLPESCPDYLASTGDGRGLIVFSSGELSMYDLQLGGVRWRLAGESFTSVAYHPRTGLFAARNDAIVELSPDDGAVLRMVARCPSPLRAIAIDPHGESLSWIDVAGGITRCRLGDGCLQWQQLSHGSKILPASHRAIVPGAVLAFSPDGEHLVTTAHEGEWILAVWNAHTGERQKTLRGHDDRVRGATFLADGILASWGNDGTLRFWNVQRGALRDMVSARELRGQEPRDPDSLLTRIRNLFFWLRPAQEAAPC
jgi:WD40 repeat protein